MDLLFKVVNRKIFHFGHGRLLGPTSVGHTVLDFYGNDDFNVNVYGTFLLSTVAYWVFGALFTLVDLTGKPNALLKYKIQSGKPEKVTVTQVIEVAKVVICNQLLIIPLTMFSYRMKKMKGRVFQRELPTLSIAILSLMFFVVCREITYYYAHRILHHPFLYKHIHKKHHKWTSPIAIAAIYAHPVEHIFANIFPLGVGTAILQSHTALLWIFSLMTVYETLVVHCGYHLPGFMSPERHDYHHLKFHYNFGHSWLDQLHGTDGMYKTSKEATRDKILWTLKSAKELFP